MVPIRSLATSGPTDLLRRQRADKAPSATKFLRRLLQLVLFSLFPSFPFSCPTFAKIFYHFSTSSNFTVSEAHQSTSRTNVRKKKASERKLINECKVRFIRRSELHLPNTQHTAPPDYWLRKRAAERGKRWASSNVQCTGFYGCKPLHGTAKNGNSHRKSRNLKLSDYASNDFQSDVTSRNALQNEVAKIK